MIKEGTYNAVAESWELGKSDKGTECIAVSFKLLEGSVGARITWYGYFTEATQRRTMDAMRLCGWKGNDFFALDGLDQNMVQVVIEHEEYNGKVHARVKWVNQPNAIALKNPMDDTAKQSFAQRMKGLAMDTPEVQGPPPVESESAPVDSSDNGNGDPGYDQAPVDDDDLPF